MANDGAQSQIIIKTVVLAIAVVVAIYLFETTFPEIDRTTNIIKGMNADIEYLKGKVSENRSRDLMEVYKKEEIIERQKKERLINAIKLIGGIIGTFFVAFTIINYFSLAPASLNKREGIN